MATKWDESEVRCPFFLESSGRTIRCEGVFPNSSIAQTFSGAEVRRARMQEMCMGPYRRCGLYRRLDAKYEE